MIGMQCNRFLEQKIRLTKDVQSGDLDKEVFRLGMIKDYWRCMQGQCHEIEFAWTSW